MTVRNALAQSRNITAIEALQFVGVPEMIATLHGQASRTCARPIVTGSRSRSAAAK